MQIGTLNPKLGLLLISMPFIITRIAAFFILISLNGEIDRLNLDRYLSYIHITVFYFIVTVIFISEKKLDSFNIDKLSVILLIVMSIFRTRWGIDGEAYFLWIIAGFGLVIVLLFLKRRSQMTPMTKKIFWESISWGLIAFVFVDFFETLRLLFGGEPIYAASFSLFTVVQNSIYNLSFAAIDEEFIFRAFFAGYLLKLGYKEKSAFLIQGVVFWLMHSHYLFQSNLIAFFVSIPILTFFTSWLTMRYKSIFPAIVVHLFINVMLGFTWSVFFS